MNGQPVRFKRRKSELLAAYLALHPGVHTREKLASLFWGNSTDEDARRALRVTLADARQTLREDALPGDRDTLSLRPDIYPQAGPHPGAPPGPVKNGVPFTRICCPNEGNATLGAAGCH